MFATQVSLGIREEVQDHNRLLDGMEATFGRARTGFSATMVKMGEMVRTGSCRNMCYLVAFVVAVFFLLYYLASRK